LRWGNLSLLPIKKPPTVDWDQPSCIQMAIETHDWNPVPEDGGLIAKSPLEERKTQYDWGENVAIKVESINAA